MTDHEGNGVQRTLGKLEERMDALLREMAAARTEKDETRREVINASTECLQIARANAARLDRLESALLPPAGGASITDRLAPLEAAHARLRWTIGAAWTALSTIALYVLQAWASRGTPPGAGGHP